MSSIKLSLLIPFLLLACNTFAQNYTRTVGTRGGEYSGVTYQSFIKEDVAFEAFLSFSRGGIRLGALKQFYKPALFEFSDNLYFGYGFGTHVG